ncbi:hypothetical protein AB1N83_013236 [Pleurotus pulmonarius]
MHRLLPLFHQTASFSRLSLFPPFPPLSPSLALILSPARPSRIAPSISTIIVDSPDPRAYTRRRVTPTSTAREAFHIVQTAVCILVVPSVPTLGIIVACGYLRLIACLPMSTSTTRSLFSPHTRLSLRHPPHPPLPPSHQPLPSSLLCSHLTPQPHAHTPIH